MSGSADNRSVKRWLDIADVLARAGLTGEDPAAHATMLREAGADVTRDSRARWRVQPGGPQVVAWLYSLDGAAAARFGG